MASRSNSIPTYLKKFEGLRFFFSGRDFGDLLCKEIAIAWVQKLGGTADAKLSKNIDYYISSSALHSPTKQDQRVFSWNEEANADISILSPDSLLKFLRPTPRETMELLRGDSSHQRMIEELPLERRINLSKRDFSGRKLSGLNFENVCLDRTNLNEADLRGSSLWSLKGATLRKAKLTGATFVEQTSNCDFSGADLTGAELGSIRTCTFSGTTLNNAELIGDLRKCVFDKANCRSLCLRYANAKQLDLRGLDLRGALFQGVDFTGADFTGCNLSGAKIYDSTMIRAKLVDANLSKAHIESVDLSKTNLSGANFRATNFSNVTFPSTTLGRALENQPNKNLT